MYPRLRLAAAPSILLMESSKNFTMNLGEKIISEFCTIDFEFRCSRKCYKRDVKRKRMPSRASRKARTLTE